jgi:uncharacterized membrane protein
MNKAEFMKRLKKRLALLPHEEYNDAIEYYEQYFMEAEDEQGAIMEFGQPEAVAAKILADYADAPAKGNRWKKVWTVVLAIFAAPVALPLAAALGATAIALLFATLAVIVSLLLSGVAILASGVTGSVLSFIFIFESLATTLFFVGIGLICGCAGFALIHFSLWLAKKCAAGLPKLFGKVLRRGYS